MKRNAPDTGAEYNEPDTDGLGLKTAGLRLETAGLRDGNSRHDSVFRDSFFPRQCCGVLT